MVLKSAPFSFEIHRGETLFKLPSSLQEKMKRLWLTHLLFLNNKWERDFASSSFFAFLL